MYDISGHKVKKAYSQWEILLDEWMAVMQRYFRVSKGDLPYWHNERANVGILAAAAWRCGYIALEEYGEVKHNNNVNVKYQGRVDLWIGRPDCVEGEQIEAKFGWFDLDPKNFGSFLDRVLEDSKAAAQSTQKGSEITTYAVNFIVPVVNPDLKQEDAELQLLQLIEVINEIDIEIKAWYFPQQFRAIANHQNKIFPGVILLGKEVI